MKSILKNSGWADIIQALIFAIIGIFLIVQPELSTQIASYVIGGVCIAIGIVKCVDYFISKGKYDFYNYDIVYGIIAIIIGLITIFCSGLIESIFRITIACWIIYSGLMRLSLSTKLHTAKIDMWSVSLILSLIMIVGGLCMLFQSGALALTIGIIMLVYSIIDIIESLIFIKNIDKLDDIFEKID